MKIKFLSLILIMASLTFTKVSFAVEYKDNYPLQIVNNTEYPFELKAAHSECMHDVPGLPNISPNSSQSTKVDVSYDMQCLILLSIAQWELINKDPKFTSCHGIQWIKENGGHMSGDEGGSARGVCPGGIGDDKRFIKATGNGNVLTIDYDEIYYQHK